MKKYYYGYKVSYYAEKNGYVDYATLAKVVGNMILNDEIAKNYELDLYCGEDYDEETETFVNIYQYYMISKRGADFLAENTNEIVYYVPGLNIYLWGITHLGTSWNYVLTDIKLED